MAPRRSAPLVESLRRLHIPTSRRSSRRPRSASEIELLDLVSSPDAEGRGFKKRIRRFNPKAMRRNPRRACNGDNDDESLHCSLIVSKRAKKTMNGRCTNSRQQNQLDTNLFESYLEALWRNASESKKRSFVCLDSLWFSLYKEGLTDKGTKKDKVLRWITEKQIFLCDYVFVPIVCWRHWNLLILCHIGENIDSKTKRPCMLLLDSLEKSDPKRLEPDIRRFVWDIYKTSLNKRITGKEISKIPLLVPKVPQQRNGDDCGIFVLFFIHLFLRTAPEVFNLEHYPYFLTKKWFNFDELVRFREELVCEEIKVIEKHDFLPRAQRRYATS